jgi:hypothetical protein
LRVSDIRSKERLETYEIYFDRQADVAFHARHMLQSFTGGMEFQTGFGATIKV